jgi:hypothetical protein
MAIVKQNFIKILTIILLGILFHNMFSWLNNPKYLAFLFPVNESVWEHLKLTWLPFILYGIFEVIVLNKNCKEVIIKNSFAIFFSFIFIILIDYILNMILPSQSFITHMANYIISIVLSIIMSTYLYDRYGNKLFVPSVFIFHMLSLLVILFTYVPPDCYLFQG